MKIYYNFFIIIYLYVCYFYITSNIFILIRLDIFGLIYYVLLVMGKFSGLLKNFPYLLIKLEIIIPLRLV